MKVQGIYRILDEDGLNKVWEGLGKATDVFHGRVCDQLAAICQAADGFSHFQSAKYTVRQFITDHREIRYVPSWMLIEAVNLGSSTVSLIELDTPTYDDPEIVEAGVSPFVPARSTADPSVIDAGAIQIHRHAAGVSFAGEVPESASQFGGYNAFWEAVEVELRDYFDRESIEESEGGSIASSENEGFQALALGKKHTHDTAATVSTAADTANKAAEEPSAPLGSSPKLSKVNLPKAQPVAPAACALDDRSCEACS